LNILIADINYDVSRPSLWEAMANIFNLPPSFEEDSAKLIRRWRALTTREDYLRKELRVLKDLQKSVKAAEKENPDCEATKRERATLDEKAILLMKTTQKVEKERKSIEITTADLYSQQLYAISAQKKKLQTELRVIDSLQKKLDSPARGEASGAASDQDSEAVKKNRTLLFEKAENAMAKLQALKDEQIKVQRIFAQLLTK
jgi:hypothetical protein